VISTLTTDLATEPEDALPSLTDPALTLVFAPPRRIPLQGDRRICGEVDIMKTIFALIVLFGSISLPLSALAIGPVDACCKESCAEPMWTACQDFICQQNSSACNDGFAEQIVGGVPCGEGGADDCPTTETGQCADDVNNDVWLDEDGLTDCDDPDCFADPDCAHKAPAVGPGALAVITLLLGGAGAIALRRRRHS